MIRARYAIASGLLLILGLQADADSLLTGTENTRDLGGYLTSDGLVIRRHMVFRSDELSRLTDADLQTLDQWQLASLTDFRTKQEKEEAPNRLPVHVPTIDPKINNLQLDIKAIRQKIFTGQLTQKELAALLDRRPYINDSAIRREWGIWLASLSQNRHLPHLFHCRAGKDRTGFAAAILLLTLGVPERRVMQDFLLSNRYLADKTDQTIRQIGQNNPSFDAEKLRPLLGVSEISLSGALTEMRGRFGSVDAYIRKGLGIDTATQSRLRSRLLSDPAKEGRRLTSDEIRLVFSGLLEQSQIADARGTSATNVWRPDGTFVSRWRNDLASSEIHGTWHAKDNQRCVSSGSLDQDSCYTIFEFEEQYFSINPDGSVHGAHKPSALRTGEAAEQ